MSNLSTWLLSAVTTLCATNAVHAQLRVERPFPLRATGRVEGAISLVPDVAALRSLEEMSTVVLTDVPSSTGPRTVRLERIPLERFTHDMQLKVNGQPSQLPDLDLTLWHGDVDGVDGSSAYFAFSPHGSRGWMHAEGKFDHLLAQTSDWNAAPALMVSEEVLNARGDMLRHVCHTDELPRPAQVRPAPIPSGTASLATTTLACRVAVETDWQLTQQFGGNATATLTYVLSLWGAGSQRYYDQIDTVLEISQLTIYSNSNDPWVTADNGGNSIDMLYAFQAAWQGAIPAASSLGHFLSGAGLGGGVAWLDVLCNQTYGFGVSGNLSGQTSFPVTQGPLTWDFMVFTHELGHNFGSAHTHDFCPPLDSCAPNGYYGQCQTSQQCTNSGTIMSYCHLCSGGMNNIYPYFHQECANVMRSRAAQAACMSFFCLQPTTYCTANPNSTGAAASISALGSNSLAAANLTLRATNVPANTVGLFYYGNNKTNTPFGNGVRCVNGAVYRLPTSNSGAGGVLQRALNFGTAPIGSGPGRLTAGSVWHFQAWYRNPAGGGSGFNLSNALTLHVCP